IRRCRWSSTAGSRIGGVHATGPRPGGADAEGGTRPPAAGGAPAGARELHADGHRPARRQGERRTRREADAELQVDRWIAIPRASGHIDFRDPDARAILFLCCNQHAVPCQKCQNTYRIGWISRSDPELFPCPLCGSNLIKVVAAHAQVCAYWVNREAAGKRPLSRVVAAEPPAQAATG